MFNPADWPGVELHITEPLHIAKLWYVGLDLGQAQDYSALAVIEKSVYYGVPKPATYACRHLQRFALGTPYPAIVEAVDKLLKGPTPRGNPSPLADAVLVIDATGVGRAVVDMFRHEREIGRLVRVAITGGLSANFDGKSGTWHVPKKELVSVLQALMQTRRLTVARELALAEVLTKELLTFKVKITTAGNETFEAWRERDHDDLVLALAIGLWYGERDINYDDEPPFGVMCPGKTRF